MVKLLIIADDFTGALDTGIQFQKRGIATQVFTKTDITRSEIKPDTEVLVIDSETRPLPSKTAYEIVYRITAFARETGIGIVFKKTDSALRGNVGSELNAVVDAAKEKSMIFLPGYPEFKRITKNGTHYIDGELLENSVFSEDPFEPVKLSYIPDIIKKQSALPVYSISSYQMLPILPEQEPKIILCDTVTTEDIDSRLDELLKRNCLKLIAGCAGLADRLAEKLDFSHQKKKDLKKTDGLYVACGSLNKITKRQLDYAERYGGFARIHLSSMQKLVPDYYKTEEGIQFADKIIRLCREQKKVIVDSFDEPEQSENFLKEHNRNKADIRCLISKAHGCIVNEIVKHQVPITILMTGGDTLMGYMKLIGCSQIEPVCEIETGIAVSRLFNEGIPVQVISKSGGFGGEDILCRITDKLWNKENDEKESTE